MKITGTDVDNQIVRLIKEEPLSETIDDNMDMWRIYEIGFINGLNALGDVIKEMLDT